MRELLPGWVSVAEAHGPPEPGAEPHPGELASTVTFVPGRRDEFVAARACARRALGDLGLAEAAVPVGPEREPLWPAGVVGSITHCEGYRAAAVTRDPRTAGVGIDAEPDVALTERVAGLVVSAADRGAAVHEDLPERWETVVFSAKEAVYKAWWPLHRRWLDFADVHLELRGDGTFHGHVLVEPHPVVEGRWTVRDGLVLTAAIIPAPGG